MQENNQEEATHFFELKLRGGPKSPFSQYDRTSTFKSAGLAGENLPPNEQQWFWKNLFSQPRRTKRPL